MGIPNRIHNRIGWRAWLGRLQGSPIDLDLRSYDEPLADITRPEAELAVLSDGALEERARRLRDRARAGEPLDALRVSAFAHVSLERAKGGMAAAKAVAIGVATGVGAFFGMPLLMVAAWAD